MASWVFGFISFGSSKCKCRKVGRLKRWLLEIRNTFDSGILLLVHSTFFACIPHLTKVPLTVYLPPMSKLWYPHLTHSSIRASAVCPFFWNTCFSTNRTDQRIIGNLTCFWCGFLNLVIADLELFRFFNPLSANPQKLVKHTQTICKFQMNCLSVLDHFVRLAL